MDDRVAYDMEGAALSADMDLALEAFLPHRLDVLNEIVIQAMTALIARRQDLALPEWRVLATLGRARGITAKDISVAARMHKTKVSRAVAALEEKGLVSRQLNRADLREAFLSLTPKGRKAHMELTPLVLRFSRRLTETLAHDEQLALDAIMTRVSEQASALLNEIEQR